MERMKEMNKHRQYKLTPTPRPLSVMKSGMSEEEESRRPSPDTKQKSNKIEKKESKLVCSSVFLRRVLKRMREGYEINQQTIYEHPE